MKIAILTSPNQWFISYVHLVKSELGISDVYMDHHDIDKAYDIMFVISYHSIIKDDFIKKNKHNIVIHESAFPKRRG